MRIFAVCHKDHQDVIQYLTEVSRSEAAAPIGSFGSFADVDNWRYNPIASHALLFQNETMAYEMARHLTDPEAGPVWFVKEGELNI